MYVRFARLEGYRVWHRITKALQNDADLLELFIDATIVRAHLHGAGIPKNVADLMQGAALIEAISTDAVIANKGYDCNQFSSTWRSSHYPITKKP